jgi:glucose/arabinose dehydrogenase
MNRSFSRHASAWFVAAILEGSAAGAAVLNVPPGFEVMSVAGPEVRFPMFATLDDQGRLYVTESSGQDLYAELSNQVRGCRIRCLEDRDGDGRYETSRVFAEGLVPSMGIVWHEGKIYAADPPDLVTLEDTVAAIGALTYDEFAVFRALSVVSLAKVAMAKLGVVLV